MNPRTDSYLAMPGVADQRHLRGAINAAYGQLAASGVADAALTLFDRLAEAWAARAPDAPPLADLDPLQPAALARQARDRLGALAEFIDPGLDPAGLRQALAHVVAARGRGVARVAREARAACDRAVQDAFAAAAAALTAAAADAPDRARPLAAQVKRVLQALAFPPADAEPLAAAQKCLKALEQVQARAAALPPATREFVAARLAAECQAALARALDALAAELAEEEFRRQQARLAALLDELAARGAEFAKRLAAVRAALEARRRQAALDRHVSRASVVLPLPGQDEAEVLTGLVARAHAPDLGALAERLLDGFESRLREQAARLCPHLDPAAAPLSELVRGCDPDAAAAVFARLVEDSAGPGHTVYEAVERVGVGTVAEFLYRRAAPTVHLGDRDTEQFRVSPLVLAVVRLPPAVGPRDPAIRDRLREALGRFGPCTFTDGAAEDRVVTVVRARVGWPIGIESSNRALMERYLKAGSDGHRPHLVGFVPDAPLGQVSPSVADMAAAGGADAAPTPAPPPTKEDS
jgi:hypothetical protein